VIYFHFYPIVRTVRTSPHAGNSAGRPGMRRLASWDAAPSVLGGGAGRRVRTAVAQGQFRMHFSTRAPVFKWALFRLFRFTINADTARDSHSKSMRKRSEISAHKSPDFYE